MTKSTQEYHLLGDVESDSDGAYHEESPRHARTGRSWPQIGLYVFCFCSVLLNVVSVGLFMRRPASQQYLQDVQSKWANLKYEVETPIYAGTKYGPLVSSEEEMDRHWNALDVSPGLVRLSDEYADENGLPHSMRFPWDQSQGMYYLGAFHQIHCLKEIHFWMSDMKKGINPKSDYHHVQHCVDTLLQDSMCHADDLPWYQLPGGEARKKYAKVQYRKCKNFDQLLDWTKQHNACFQYDNVTDPFGHETKEQDEHYRYCPEDSPWIPEMQKYFEEKYKSSKEKIQW